MHEKRIGIVSDTHGLLREEVKQAFRGVDLIIHAGDIGRQEILTQLNQIAPIVAVKGNVDTDEWADDIPLTNVIEFYGLKIFVIHNIKQIDFNQKEFGVDIVIYGHSHKSANYKDNGITYINPGSAGRKRFKLPISYAMLKIIGDKFEVEIKTIE